MDSRRLKPKQKPKIHPLDKKIKPNPKYQNIQPVTDTGNNARKQLERLEEIRQFYRFRPDELFRRVTVSSLVGMMIEVSKLDFQEGNDGSSRKTSSVDLESSIDLNSSVSEQDHQEESPSSDLECDKDSLDGEKEEPKEPVYNPDMYESVVFKGKMLRRTLSTQSQLHSSLGDLISGVSNVEIHRPHNQQVHSARAFHHQNSWNAASLFSYEDNTSLVGSKSQLAKIDQAEKLETSPLPQEDPKPIEDPPIAVVDRPFLLLDIRQAEDFKRSHIVTAKSYPANRLSRAVNFESKEMLHYKNKEGKMIIVYDYDESISHKFATTLIQRGYDNVFMLSGGIRITQIKFPNCLIRKGEQLPNDPEERLSEEEVHVLEAFLEESHASGAGRLPPGKLQYRMQSSVYNLPKNPAGSTPGIQRSKRALLHSPIRTNSRSASIGRS